MNKLLVLGKKNILGLESFFYQIPYITNARVISPKAKLIKIDKEHLYQIIIRSNECLGDLKSKVHNTLKIISHRLFGINNNKLKRIDNFINLDNTMKLEKLETEMKTESKLIIKNPFISRKINSIKQFKRKIPSLINTSAEVKNITNSSLLNKRPILKSALYKKRHFVNFFKQKKIVSDMVENQIMKKIKKEILKRKNFITLIKSRTNVINNNINNNEEKNIENNLEEKTEQINKLTNIIKKFNENIQTSDNNNSFEFVTKIDNVNSHNIYDNLKIKSDLIIKENEDNKTRNKNLPKIIVKNNSEIGRNSFLSIISNNLTKSVNRAMKDLNINFSYNNRVIKNYSFINRYLYKDSKEKITLDNIDPKERYKIFDNYSKIIPKSKNKEIKADFIQKKRYIPKIIKSKSLAIKIKRYQEYRKKIQKKIEEINM